MGCELILKIHEQCWRVFFSSGINFLFLFEDKFHKKSEKATENFEFLSLSVKELFEFCSLEFPSFSKSNGNIFSEGLFVLKAPMGINFWLIEIFRLKICESETGILRLSEFRRIPGNVFALMPLFSISTMAMSRDWKLILFDILDLNWDIICKHSKYLGVLRELYTRITWVPRNLFSIK